jgi:zinc protease
MNRFRVSRWTALSLAKVMLAASSGANAQTTAGPEASAPSMFHLDNGLEVVVVPDRRLPVVTHMMFYKVGAADEPQGRSGLAHLLEHLMFKATAHIGPNEYPRIISRIGARDNAITSADMTFYYQRVPKEALRQVMQLEADRVRGLKFDDAEILLEREVVVAERRTNIDGEPLSLLSEQMLTVLYANHPYRTPAIGWPHELMTLTRADAEPFYRRHYAPNNAILVIAGDVTLDDMKLLTREMYGALPAAAQLPNRIRPSEPEPRAARRVVYQDQRATSPVFVRMYTTPSYASANGREAEALELLAQLLGQGDTSRLADKLVVDLKVAIAAAASYSGEPRDGGRMALFALPAQGVSVDAVEVQVNAVVAEIVDKGVTEADLATARNSLEAKQTFDNDSQYERARRIGEALANGRSLSDIDASRQRLRAVTVDDLTSVARRYLDSRRSVTGLLLPAASAWSTGKAP